jgi:hypothetical protein
MPALRQDLFGGIEPVLQLDRVLDVAALISSFAAISSADSSILSR